MKFFIPCIILLLSACSSLGEPAAKATAEPAANALQAQAIAAFEAGKYAEASPLLAQAIKAQGKEVSLKLLFTYAESLRLEGKPTGSIPFYDKVLSVKPKAQQVLEGKGLALLGMGKVEEAIPLFNAVIAKDATRWHTVNALGVAYALQDRSAEALEYFESAQALSDNNPVILNNIGLGLALNENAEEAVNILEEARSHLEPTDPRYARTAQNLALVYGLAGQPDLAEAELQPYLNKQQIYNNLGYYATLRSDKALARTYFSKAISTSPSHYEKAWQNMEGVEE